MMGPMALLIAVAVAWLAFVNGANDNFKGVATLYGSRTLAYRPALAWATITTAAGSLCAGLLAGGLVQRFSGRGLVPEAVAVDPAFLLAVGLGAAGTVLLATRFGFPVSTTHALTGALLGAGVSLAGASQVSYATLASSFFLPLLLSPLLALGLAALIHSAARWTRHALGVSEEMCVCVGGVSQLATLVPGAGMVELASGLRVTVDTLESCESRYVGTVLGFSVQRLLDRLHVLSAGSVGFARGLNDTPKIAALMVAAGALGATSSLGFVALAIAAGGLLAARRVAATMSFGITRLNHGQGFSANLVTGVLVALASPLGLPVSTTQVSCGALFGIGVVSGEARWNTITRILGAWLVTLPLAALLAALASAPAGWIRG
jgi:PiT family inorganic phosphate transporter